MVSDRFVDTGGWAAWANGRDVFHAQARAQLDETWQAGGRLVTTNWVLCELTALFVRMRIDKPSQIQFFDDLALDPDVVVVVIDPAFEAAAWTLWRSRPDKDWTLCDCASFEVMQARRLTEAVTTDHHFEQAGFTRLLR